MLSFHRFALAGTASVLIATPAMSLLVGPAPALASATARLVPTVGSGESAIRLAGHTAPEVLDGRATRLNHYDTTQNLRLTIALQPPHLAEEERFLKELQTKESANFHKFLSAEEWNTRFGPSQADEQKVLDWAQSQGFSVTGRFSNRLLVNVEAPVGVIESGLGVTINIYQVDRKSVV